MANLRLKIFIALLFLGVSAGPARPQDPAQAEFVDRIVDAINSKSVDRRKALLHPKSLVCASAESGSFYSEMTSRQARQPISAGYKWKITPISANHGPLFADKFDYPIRPSHLLQLDFSTGPASATSMILQIIFETNQWREVTACPKPETIAAANKAEQLRMEQAKRVELLVTTISSDLRQTVVKLVKEGQKVDAIKHYAKISGENLSTAKGRGGTAGGSSSVKVSIEFLISSSGSSMKRPTRPNLPADHYSQFVFSESRRYPALVVSSIL